MNIKELEKLPQREIKEYLEKLPENEALNLLKLFSPEWFNSVKLEVGFVNWAVLLIKQNRKAQEKI